MPDEFELSRRKALAALGTVGVASAGAGLGTSAFFSDQETFENNQLTAGTLDMKVGWEEHYSDWSEDEADHAHMEDGELVVDDRQGFMDATLQEQFPDKQAKKELDEGTADPCDVLADVPDDLERPVIELEDVKPGDFGEVTFTFALCDNPGYLWLNGELLENAENGLTEPEADDPSESNGASTQQVPGGFSGELADALWTTIWYDDDCDNVSDGDERVIYRGSLRNALTILGFGFGVPLDGDRTTTVDEFVDPPDDERRDCFSAAPDHHCLGVRWELPADHGNEVQSDSVVFDLGFYGEQCRHNLGWGLQKYHHCQKVANTTGGAAHDLHINLVHPATPGPNGEAPTAAYFGEGTIAGNSIDFSGATIQNGDIVGVCWWDLVRRNRINPADPGYWTDAAGNQIGEVQVLPARDP